MRILVVDDSEAAGTLLGLQLETLGHTVEVLSDPGEALERLRGGAPVDAVLADLVMPAMRGDRFAARVAALPHPPPVLGISGSAPPDDLDSSGLRAVLLKPVPLERLRAALLACRT